MSIGVITAKIVNDATEYANGLISEANQEAESILARAEKEAEAIRERMAVQGADDAVTVRHRNQSAAELEGRKMRLAARQKAVADTMDAAVDHLVDMEPEAYISFLAAKIAETGIKEGELLLSAKDRGAIGEKLVKAANKSLKNGKLTLSDQVIKAKGGFVLKYGALEINSSLEIMVHSVKEAVASEVLAALYQEFQE
jgi:V/A-type H+-transporting ATPase subunit E